MKKKWMNKKFLLVLALIAILLVSIPGTFSFIVAKTETLLNVFVPARAFYGNVIINKEVQHPYGENFVIPDTIFFDFEVDLGPFYAGSEIETSDGMYVADENGVITVSVYPGKPFRLRGIEEDTQVTITEVSMPFGFAPMSGISSTVIVGELDAAVADFVNGYIPEELVLSNPLGLGFDARITKNIAGRDWQADDVFEFRVERYDESSESWLTLGTAEITGSSGENYVSLNDILSNEVYSTIGTYLYRICEMEGDIADMTYDTVPRHFSVEITDEDMNGEMELADVRSERGSELSFNYDTMSYELNAIFNNIYEKPQLNTEDHYGYIMGYPVDYRTNEPTEDRSLWPVRPEGDITRAEVATLFFRMLTDESRVQYWSKTNTFSDVDESAWYNNAISTLANAGILNGYADGTFKPDGKITRAELAVIAVRFLHAEEVYVGEDRFSDIAGHWAQHEINVAAEKGLFMGYPDSSFAPDQEINRAEAVSVVNRSLERKPHKDHLLPDMAVWPDNMDTSVWYYADMQEATNSHSYEMKGEGADIYEVWIEILPNRDWTKLEKEWSDSNSVGDGGDVMGD